MADLARSPAALPVSTWTLGRGAAARGARGPTTVWDNAIRSIEAELTARHEGHRQAVLAHLTLLLIELARLARDVVADLRRSGEPLLADVFAVIDLHHGEPLSLKDVAGEIGMTPGHLTTVVRRRTGRTVVEWIIERRMAKPAACWPKRIFRSQRLPGGWE